MELEKFTKVRCIKSDNAGKLEREINEHLALGWRMIQNWLTDSGHDQHPHILLAWPEELGEPQYPQQPSQERNPYRSLEGGSQKETPPSTPPA